jgi:hypothetical protein
LILRLWRGETSHDRQAKARTERERAELEAETAIAVKRAEVRAAAETMWAEQQLAQARMAVEAQTEIDRVQLRQRVSAALESATPVAERIEEEEMYLPIAAAAEAASRAATGLSDTAVETDAIETPNLPATAESGEGRATPPIPTIPDVTRAAARWIRPLVPGLVARAIDTSTHPLRTARQVLEEVEEITFSLKRTRRVVVDTAETARPGQSGGSAAIRASNDDRFGEQTVTPTRLSAADVDDLPLTQRDPQPGLTQRPGPPELHEADGPRQLPPAT